MNKNYVYVWTHTHARKQIGMTPSGSLGIFHT